MKKLKLNFDELKVESFSVQNSEQQKGTVNAQEQNTTPMFCYELSGLDHTCDNNTCNASCYNGSCNATCDESCNGTCFYFTCSATCEHCYSNICDDIKTALY